MQELVRGVKFSKAIAAEGKSFSEDYVRKYYEADENGFSKQSRPLNIEKGEEFDAFWSYRWKTGRFRMWCSILSYYNSVPALLITLAVSWVIWLALGFIADPESTWIPYSVYPNQLQTKPYDLGHWWVVPWLGPIVFFIFIIFYSMMFRRNMLLFLDKHSVAQLCPNLAAAGIRALPASLSKCKSLVCFIDNEYFNRLWTCYEIAAYLRIRKMPDVRIVNVYIQMIIFWYCISSVIEQLTLEWMRYLLEPDAAFCAFAAASVNVDCSQWSNEQSLVGGLLVLACTVTVGIQFWIGFMYFDASADLQTQAKTFDVRNAGIHDQEARNIILDSIAKMFSDEPPSPIDGVDNKNDSKEHENNEKEEKYLTNEEIAGACLGVARFNVFVRRAITFHSPQSIIDRWRFLTYTAVLVTNTFPLVATMSQTGYNFYAFWDDRNKFHDGAASIEQFFLLIFWEFFVRLPFVEYFRGVMVCGLWHLSKMRPLKWCHWSVWFIILWFLNAAYECFLNDFLLSGVIAMTTQTDKFPLQGNFMHFFPFTVWINYAPWWPYVGWTVVVLITIATWFLYEPLFSRGLRRRMWVNWCKKRTASANENEKLTSNLTFDVSSVHMVPHNSPATNVDDNINASQSIDKKCEV